MDIAKTETYRKDNFIRVAADVELGADVQIYCFANLYGCKIGQGTRIGSFVEIQRGAVIGPRCKISSHTFICEGVTIEEECFIGHGVMFINDRHPAAVNPDGTMKQNEDWKCEITSIGPRVAIGSGAVIMCGIRIGAGAMIGAGAVVTKNVEAGVIVAGIPARVLNRRTAKSE